MAYIQVLIEETLLFIYTDIILPIQFVGTLNDSLKIERSNRKLGVSCFSFSFSFSSFTIGVALIISASPFIGNFTAMNNLIKEKQTKESN